MEEFDTYNNSFSRIDAEGDIIIIKNKTKEDELYDLMFKEVEF